MRGFLKKKKVDSEEDFSMQVQMWAYIIAKHYGILLAAVYEMPSSLFQQSLIWALAINEEQEKERAVQKQKSKSKGNETVSLDYEFLDWE